MKDALNKPKRTFNNAIVVSKQEIYICTTTGINKAYFYRWDESITRYVKQKEWPIALKMATLLNAGKLCSFYSLPVRTDAQGKREFKNFCVNLVMSYLEKEEARIAIIADKQQQSNAVWTLCKTTFEYLIEIAEYDILFRQTKIFFMRLDYGHVFLALLEPFILRNQLKRIPNEYFNEILQYLVEKKKF